jgi:membrane protease YdiL (CAAX protease family)
MEQQEFPSQPVEIQPSLEAQPLTFIERHGISPVLFVFLSLIGIFFLYQGIPAVISAIFFRSEIMHQQPIISENNVDGWRAFTGVSQLAFLLLPTLLLARLISFRPKNFLQIRMPKAATLLVPLIGIFSLQQMLQIYLIFQEKIPIPDALEKMVHELKEALEVATRLLTGSHSIPELLWVVLIIAVIPAIAEELFFRGLIQRSLEKQYSPMQAAIVTGVIFGAYHLNPSSFIPLAILGSYLGFLVMRTKSILVSMAAHFYNNAFACAAIYFGKNEDALITGNADEMSTPALLAAFWFFGLIFLLSTYYFLHITKAKEEAIVPS